MKEILIYYHIVAFSIGVLLDLIIGDPYWMPHPIRLIGRLIGWLDKAFMDKVMSTDGPDESIVRNEKREKTRGFFCVLIVVTLTLIITILITGASYYVHHGLGIIVEAILTSYCLAARSLSVESKKVYKAIQNNDIEGARHAVSMIVGRDTDALDKKGIIKAAVETVAENTSDGVIAPMLYLILMGPVGGMTYKAINTMDSMIGYHNDRYENFGKCAAKLDDIVNFIPSRLSAYLMIIASFFPLCFVKRSINIGPLESFENKIYNNGKAFSGKGALKIYRRDRFNHKSPNSAQTESVCAGSLGIRLAGDAYYFGKLVKKPFIGDETREIENEDIKRAGILMYTSAAFLFALGKFLLYQGVFLCASYLH